MTRMRRFAAAACFACSVLAAAACDSGGSGSILTVSATGNDVGVVVQLHFYFDDLFPRSLGRPVFGR